MIYVYGMAATKIDETAKTNFSVFPKGKTKASGINIKKEKTTHNKEESLIKIPALSKITKKTAERA
ncbi:hypothetical protein GCM10009016_27450 [Halomonas beimenensis]